MTLAGPYSSGAAVGTAGNALADADTPIRLTGEVMGIYVEYVDSPPATTDVVIKSVGTDPAPPTYNLLSLANANTSGWFYPHHQIHTTAGVPIAAEYTPILIDDYLNVSIDGANAGDSVNVWLLLR